MAPAMELRPNRKLCGPAQHFGAVHVVEAGHHRAVAALVEVVLEDRHRRIAAHPEVVGQHATDVQHVDVAVLGVAGETGVKSTRSLTSSRLTSRMNSPVNAVTASGTSDRASARRCTVTTISSMTPGFSGSRDHGRAHQRCQLWPRKWNAPAIPFRTIESPDDCKSGRSEQLTHGVKLPLCPGSLLSADETHSAMGVASRLPARDDGGSGVDAGREQDLAHGREPHLVAPPAADGARVGGLAHLHRAGGGHGAVLTWNSRQASSQGRPR
jgi:hypothetical protein